MKHQVVVLGLNPALESLVRHLAKESAEDWQCRFFPTVGSYLQAPRLDSQIDLLIFDGLSASASQHEKRLICFQAPLALRVVLTTPEYDDVVMGHLRNFHSFIGIELHSEHLRQLFSNAERLSALPLRDEQRRLIGGLTDFPLVPAMLQALDQLLVDNNVSVSAVAHLISKDTLVVSRVFQLVNSPYMGFASESWNLEVAISRLGYGTLRSLVLLLSMQHLQQDDPKALLLMEQILVEAGLARSYARSAGFSRLLQDQVFAAALLSGFGALVLLHNGREPGDAELQPSNPSGRLSYIAVSAYMLTLWGFEDWIISAVLNQQQFQSSGVAAQISNCLYLARRQDSADKGLTEAQRQQALQAGFVL